MREETGKVAAESVIKRGSVLHTSAPSLSEAKPEPGSARGFLLRSGCLPVHVRRPASAEAAL